MQISFLEQSLFKVNIKNKQSNVYAREILHCLSARLQKQKLRSIRFILDVKKT